MKINILLKNKLTKSPIILFQILSLFFSLNAQSATIENNPTEFDLFDDSSHSDNFLDNPFNSLPNFLEFEVINTNRARAIAQKGLNSLKKGNKQEALKNLREAWEIDPNTDTTGLLIILTYIEEGNYSEAHKAAIQLQENTPTNTQGYVLEGIVYSLEGNHIKSQESYTKAIKIDSGSPSANQNLAAYAITNKDYGKARKLYKAVLNKRPEHIKTLSKLAKLENLAGQTEEAIKRINQAISKEPNSLEPRITAAQIHLSAGQAKKALQVLEPILATNETSAGILEAYGRAKLLDNQPIEAAKIFLKWSELYPDQKWAFFYLSSALEQLNMIGQALESIDRALKIDNSHLLSKISKAKLLALKGDLPAAKKMLLALKKSNESPFEGYLAELQGQIALAENQPEKAVAYFKTARNQRENNFITVKLAIAYMKSSQDEKAYSLLTSWLLKYPKDTFSKIALADLYLNNNQLQQAERYYLEVLKDQPENTYALNNSAWLMSQRGELEKALSNAEKAYKFAPKNVNILDTLGGILLNKGEIDRAIKLFRSGLEKNPNNNSLQFNLSLGLIKKGKKNEARVILKKLTANKNPYKKQALIKLSEL